MKALVYGLAASLFFSFTFVFNRSMDLGGGFWAWSASLRFLWMLPFLLAAVLVRRKLGPLLAEIGARPWAWLLWSTVGFGVFYAGVSYAASFGAAWLLAGLWQVTILAGILLGPLLERGRRSGGAAPKARGFPAASFAYSGLILAGIFLIQFRGSGEIDPERAFKLSLPLLLAAFAYPLGNRKLMLICGGRLDTFQRVLGMTLMSLPFWLLLSAFALAEAGPPSASQTFQSLLVALSSGLVATLLFFKATDLSRGSPSKLAAVEATQSGEIVFSLAGEILLLGGGLPPPAAAAGLGLIVLGMVLHSFKAKA